MLAACDADSSPPSSLPGASGEPYRGRQQTVDLTTRWRHLRRRVDGFPLLAAWQFDEGSGYSFDDVSGSGHLLYITGSAWNTTDSGLLGAVHRAGLRGTAVYLDGTRWLEAAPTADLAIRSGLTVSCWVRPDAATSAGAALVTLDGAYALTLEPGGAASMSATDTGGRHHVVRSPAAAVATGRWSHVVATVRPATGQLRLYVDGAPVATARAGAFAPRVAAARLRIGSGLVGALDETTLQHEALSDGAVRRLYVVGLPKVYTQTAESIDADRAVFTHFKGSEPIPHPVTGSTALTAQFAASATTLDGTRPEVEPPASSFVPGVFGGAWRAGPNALSYPSPLRGDAGTFEAWYRAVPDAADPRRLGRKQLFAATGPTGSLALYTSAGRWCVDVRRSGQRTNTITAVAQAWTPQTLEHVGVTWGAQADGAHAVVLYVNGSPAGSTSTGEGETTYSQQVALGGTAAAPSSCLLDDVRICDIALPWGDICPRGQASTEAAGLDLRDDFNRPPGAAPLLWRSGSPGALWSHRRKTWERPVAVGDDPDSIRALFQSSPAGLHPIFHPDAVGHASSIEAGVAFPTAVDGWAGVFVQASAPGSAFTAVTFMLNAALGQFRLATYVAGKIRALKALPWDFPLAPLSTYEITLTSAGDGIVRGFLDGSNVMSMRLPAGTPASGYAGMVTDGAPAFFSRLHFCALTPPTKASRVVRTRVVRYGAGAAVADLRLVPFRWHKRRGLPPWLYTAKAPEPPGNIAGAATALPLRPIPPAPWRSEDSANSDLVVVGGRMLYFMRGNPRVDGRVAAARVGVLHAAVTIFDGLHFTDPNIPTGTLTAGTVLLGTAVTSVQPPGTSVGLQLNAPSSAYVGDGRLLFFGRESGLLEAGQGNDGRLVFSHFDTRTDSWQGNKPAVAPWSGAMSGSGVPRGGLFAMHGSPEVVSLREPDHDAYQAVLIQQTGRDGRAVMATALLRAGAGGPPEAIPGMPVHTSLSRADGGSIYGFRAMFDNGIYYLHYNDGVQVPDWPDRFVLAAALDPYAGPWVQSPTTTAPDSDYFRRGTELEPDNGAIWQGTMVKHRGRYYLYYENYHSVGDVDAQYANYADPQAGSRVGFATA